MIPNRFLVAFLPLLLCAAPGSAEPLKIGYWTSGYSLGFGAVLEAGKFLEKEGVEVRYVKFGDVGAPARALLTGDVDIAFAAPAAAAFNLGLQGAPVSVILVTQVLEGKAVVRADSPLKEAKDLAGKKVGMSRPGSSTHALSLALLNGLYGIKADGITVIPGNENQLLQFLARGEIDAAILRNVTIAQAGAGELRSIFDIVDDWKRLTKMSNPPPLGVSLTTRKVVEQRPKDVIAFIKATLGAVKYGAENTKAVADILEKSANLPAADALAYAQLWNTIYIASMTKGDIDAMKSENQIFVSSAAAEGLAPESIYDPKPFDAAAR
jgi:ABC-type nitrate/sulfonate/bicarbonate transport system substrate-binding protein